MATRKSLTSRGYTSVQAGPSSTNRFLNPPRTVSEYKTVAEEVATAQDLRTAKNAVGPAAQPLRPRARVEQQQISEGYTPTPEDLADQQQFPQMNMGKREDGSYYISTNDLREAIQTGTARKAGSKGIVMGLAAVTPFAAVAKYGSDFVINRQVNELFNRENEGMLPPDEKEPGVLDKIGKAITSVPRDVFDTITSLPQTIEEEVIDPFVDAFDFMQNTIGLGSTTTPNINLAPKAKALDKVSKVSRNPFNINRVRVSYEPPAFEPTTLQKAKQNAQAVTLAQKQQANDAITAGNYGSSGSDESGGFDSGVDDSGQATGQDQYD